MRLNMGLKSALLALTVIVAAPVATTRAAEASVTPMAKIVDFAKGHPYVLMTTMALWAWAESDIRTKNKADYKWSDLPSDVKDLLKSVSVFDAQSFRKFIDIYKKYVHGLPIKLQDATTRTLEEDGSIVTVKDKKLKQKPFGLYGMFDAYALTHMKKFIDYVPVIAGFYVLLNNPVQYIGNAVEKAGK